MPKFMLMFAGSDASEGPPRDATDTATYQRIFEWFDEHGKAGRIVGGEELQPRGTAKTVRFKDGVPVVTDGPYMEAKELIGGYAIVSVPDLAAAIELAKSWPGRSAVEVRPLVEERQ